MTSQLDKLTQKGVSLKKRQETAGSLKVIFSDLIVEN